MPDISVASASFIALLVETMLYGAYAVLYSICMHILLNPHRMARSARSRSLVSIIGASALFLVSTLHLAIMLLSGVRAFLQGRNAEVSYSEIFQPSNVVELSLYITVSALADVVLIYRCYIIWDCNWKIIALPCAISGASTVCAYISAGRLTLAKPGDDLFIPQIAPWLRAAGVLTMVTNIAVTAMIAGRIWWMSRDVRKVLPRHHHAKYNKAIAAIIESGGIYSFTLLIANILIISETQGQLIVYQALAQLAGIAPTLIIVRMGLGLKPHDEAVFSTPQWDSSSSANPRSQQSVLAIEIRQEVDVENEGADAAGRDQRFTLANTRGKIPGKPSGL